MSDRPQRIIVEKRGCGYGCFTFLAVALVIGAIVTYWYVAVPLAALIIAVVVITTLQRR